MHDVAQTLERVRDRARDAQARAVALAELAGASAPPSSAEVRRIDARLAELKATPQPTLEP